MSCYVVDHKHINVLISYAIKEGVYYYDLKAKTCLRITEHNAQFIGSILLQENLKSFRYRYQGRHLKDVTPIVKSYAFEELPVENYSYADIIGACRCLDYQSCEHPGWRRSQAYEILSSITISAASNLTADSTKVWEIAA